MNLGICGNPRTSPPRTPGSACVFLWQSYQGKVIEPPKPASSTQENAHFRLSNIWKTIGKEFVLVRNFPAQIKWLHKRRYFCLVFHITRKSTFSSNQFWRWWPMLYLHGNWLLLHVLIKCNNIIDLLWIVKKTSLQQSFYEQSCEIKPKLKWQHLILHLEDTLLENVQASHIHTVWKAQDNNAF